MQARFLLGPAGSGKTWRCLAEIREVLRQDPSGPPLLLLAPKQATFQLERQLLSDPTVPGFVRLRIVSLDRLAAEVVEDVGGSLPVISEEGRVMVLRALLTRLAPGLEIFHATARLPGFARQLSLTLRELQRTRTGPDRLREQATRAGVDPALARKLRDCARLLEAYDEWLKAHSLRDADALLDEAVRGVRAAPQGLRLAGLWLDGFAEMTPQEVEFLVALAAQTPRAVFAFCLPGTRALEAPLSPWSLVGRTCQVLQTRIRALPGAVVRVEQLPDATAQTRFTQSPVLAHLERCWAEPAPFGTVAESALPPGSAGLASTLRLVSCPHPEAEAVMAAREILAHVQAGGRFRDCAILVRSLTSHASVLRRILRRYEIPFFLDRRESVAHHPLAELARFAARTVEFGWQQEDWFGALKTGLFPADPDEIALLENEALARGWEGAVWQRPLECRDDPTLAAGLERIRLRVVPPLLAFRHRLGGPGAAITGTTLAAALTELWDTLRVTDRLDNWAGASSGGAGGRPASLHRTVWQEFQSWLENLELAFPEDALTLREWLPVLESGLAGLTVGVVPPALDQVLVGAIDRSRNPNLELALVLGVNEGVFPARPGKAGLFSEPDRVVLEGEGLRLGPDRRAQLAHERYYAYIAFTRARRRLVISWADRDAEDKPLNPSPLLAHVQRLFPGAAQERFDAAGPQAAEVLHPSETVGFRVASGAAWPADLLARDPKDAVWTRLAGYRAEDTLSPVIARALYGPALRTSISALEQFASCPFKFFVTRGLRAEERREFTIDARERGSFQHEILARFHQSVTREGRRWHDLAPTEARDRVGRIAAEVSAEYRDGLFAADPESRFAARGLALALQDFLEATVGWMTTYGFEPAAVELGFGCPGDPLPPWVLELGDGCSLELRGRIDRVDVAPGPVAGQRYAVVVDYKSSQRMLDRVLLEHGLQIQLPAYLAVVCRPDLAQGVLPADLLPAGAFYVNLQGATAWGQHRHEALADPAAARRAAYRHRGRFRADLLDLFDHGADTGPSGQFAFRRTVNGGFHAGDTDPTPPQALGAMLDQVRTGMVEHGRRIMNGDIRVDPYRHRGRTACDLCDLQSVCRVDPWGHSFRVLTSGALAGNNEA